MSGRLIVFPKVTSQIMGWPETVSLSPADARAMERIHLGGVEALRTDTYRAATSTINRLFEKGLLDKSGVTALGREVAKSFAPAFTD